MGNNDFATLYLARIGRKFYGVCITGIGVHQLVRSNFLPVIMPQWPTETSGLFLFSRLAGVLLVTIGIAILLRIEVRKMSMVLTTLFTLLIVFCHIPYQLFVNPHSGYIVTWSNAFKLMALMGGAVIAGNDFSGEAGTAESDYAPFRFFRLLKPLGRIFFSLTMITFGIVHFLYAENVSKLVPLWIPGAVFWTYFAGISLIGSGIAIIAKIKVKLIGFLLGTMILLWFILLHVPRAIADPHSNMGNEITSAFQALGFSGTAFMIASLITPSQKK